MYLPRFEISSKTLTLKEFKKFIYEIFRRSFKFTKKEAYSKLNRENNLKKLNRLIYNNLSIPIKAK